MDKSVHLLTGKAKLAAVLGDPVGHSRSPRLHGYWLAKNNIDGAYVPLHVHEGHLGSALSSLAELGFAGCNLTIPHKEAALGLMDSVDEAAQVIGAVNTVIFTDGRMLGRNTDAEGFVEGLRASLAIQGKTLDTYLAHAVVLGAGGAARAVIYALLKAGVQEITLLNRSRHRADALVKDFTAIAGVTPMHVLPWDALETVLPRASLLVNATSLGMHNQPPLDVAMHALPIHCLVTDIVYTPLETPLLAAARAHGCTVVDGLHMLIHQARAGFAAWFGVWPEVDAELHALVLAG